MTEAVVDPRLTEACSVLRQFVEIKDRKHRLVTYHRCFLGKDAVALLIAKCGWTEAEAISAGNDLIDQGVIRHVCQEQRMENRDYFYSFTDDVFHGRALERWDIENPEHQHRAEHEFDVAPLDALNAELLDNVHPYAWEDGSSEELYNLVVIGAGAGGLVSAIGSNVSGARVAIIEERLMGGDCLTTGCVPSKALIRCAKAAHAVRTASNFGVKVSGFQVDFAKVMETVRASRAGIAENDSAKRFADKGMDVFMGHGKFLENGVVEVNGKKLRYKKAVIATGARAYVPPIPGLETISFLTNETLWNLTELPESLAIIGGGPIGIEMAQSFARFGSKVTVIDHSNRILPREDPEASDVIRQVLEGEGVMFQLGNGVEKIEKSEVGAKLFVSGAASPIEATHVLIAVGRAANTTNLGLENVGVEFDRRGVTINDSFQTTNSDIYACGDICSAYKFTHAADFMARSVIRNVFFLGSAKLSGLTIPWCTYTEPEVAHVGAYGHDLDEGSFDVFRQEFAHVDRAITDQATTGFVKILVKKGTDKIIGATIVGPHAGDLISEVTVAMQGNIGLGAVAATIHPYPTNADAIRRTGDFYNKTRFTPTVKGLFRAIMALRRVD